MAVSMSQYLDPAFLMIRITATRRWLELACRFVPHGHLR